MNLLKVISGTEWYQDKCWGEKMQLLVEKRIWIAGTEEVKITLASGSNSDGLVR